MTFKKNCDSILITAGCSIRPVGASLSNNKRTRKDEIMKRKILINFAEEIIEIGKIIKRRLTNYQYIDLNFRAEQLHLLAEILKNGEGFHKIEENEE